MTVGSAITTAPVLLTNGASTDIKPTVDEWIIHNIYIPDGKMVDLYRGNGTNWIDLGTITGSLYVFAFHLTTTSYLRLVNSSGESIYVEYDGIQSK